MEISILDIKFGEVDVTVLKPFFENELRVRVKFTFICLKEVKNENIEGKLQ